MTNVMEHTVGQRVELPRDVMAESKSSSSPSKHGSSCLDSGEASKLGSAQIDPTLEYCREYILRRYSGQR